MIDDKRCVMAHRQLAVAAGQRVQRLQKTMQHREGRGNAHIMTGNHLHWVERVAGRLLLLGGLGTLAVLLLRGSAGARE